MKKKLYSNYQLFSLSIILFVISLCSIIGVMNSASADEYTNINDEINEHASMLDQFDTTDVENNSNIEDYGEVGYAEQNTVEKTDFDNDVFEDIANFKVGEKIVSGDFTNCNLYIYCNGEKKYETIFNKNHTQQSLSNKEVISICSPVETEIDNEYWVYEYKTSSEFGVYIELTNSGTFTDPITGETTNYNYSIIFCDKKAMTTYFCFYLNNTYLPSESEPIKPGDGNEFYYGEWTISTFQVSDQVIETGEDNVSLSICVGDDQESLPVVTYFFDMENRIYEITTREIYMNCGLSLDWELDSWDYSYTIEGGDYSSYAVLKLTTTAYEYSGGEETGNTKDISIEFTPTGDYSGNFSDLFLNGDIIFPEDSDFLIPDVKNLFFYGDDENIHISGYTEDQFWKAIDLVDIYINDEELSEWSSDYNGEFEIIIPSEEITYPMTLKFVKDGYETVTKTIISESETSLGRVEMEAHYWLILESLDEWHNSFDMEKQAMLDDTPFGEVEYISDAMYIPHYSTDLSNLKFNVNMYGQLIATVDEPYFQDDNDNFYYKYTITGRSISYDYYVNKWTINGKDYTFGESGEISIPDMHSAVAHYNQLGPVPPPGPVPPEPDPGPEPVPAEDVLCTFGTGWDVVLLSDYADVQLDVMRIDATNEEEVNVYKFTADKYRTISLTKRQLFDALDVPSDSTISGVWEYELYDFNTGTESEIYEPGIRITGSLSTPTNENVYFHINFRDKVPGDTKYFYYTYNNTDASDSGSFEPNLSNHFYYGDDLYTSEIFGTLHDQNGDPVNYAEVLVKLNKGGYEDYMTFGNGLVEAGVPSVDDDTVYPITVTFSKPGYEDLTIKINDYTELLIGDRIINRISYLNLTSEDEHHVEFKTVFQKYSGNEPYGDPVEIISEEIFIPYDIIDYAYDTISFTINNEGKLIGHISYYLYPADTYAMMTIIPVSDDEEWLPEKWLIDGSEYVWGDSGKLEGLTGHEASVTYFIPPVPPSPDPEPEIAPASYVAATYDMPPFIIVCLLVLAMIAFYGCRKSLAFR